MAKTNSKGSVLDAAYEVLSAANEPLHVRELTRRLLEGARWKTEGKTPSATVNARIAVDIKELGDESRFVRSAPGMFTVRR
jgi:restriction system protein